jgi:PPK2 family polyphosphate:nucleotide phosphotransferase
MKRYRIKPGSRIDLKDWDPGDRAAFQGSKADAEPKLLELRDRLESLQELLYAEHKHRLLIVLQAMDAGGKDGTISHVFEGVNPQGVSVVSFKVPSSVERAHDYLWRVHACVPGNGEVVIFNRSHYEDVLIVRVHGLVPEAVWQERYDQINAFEQMLSEEGVTILKFFLHISKEEQKQRLQDRLDDPHKHWKFNLADLAERKLWPEYARAYEDVLSKTSTAWAPWHIVPANSNWYRNLVVASTIVHTLEELNMTYPEAPAGLDKIRIE